MFCLLSYLVILILASIFRAASKKKVSVIGIARCDPADHAILIVLILICICISGFNARWVNKMYKDKVALKYPFV